MISQTQTPSVSSENKRISLAFLIFFGEDCMFTRSAVTLRKVLWHLPFTQKSPRVSNVCVLSQKLPEKVVILPFRTHRQDLCVCQGL